MTTPTLLGELKSMLEEAAFLVSKAVPQEAHALIVKALVLVSRLEDVEQDHKSPEGAHAESHSSTTGNPGNRGSLPSREREEVSKVRSRLRRWTCRPQQINTRILSAYLELERSGVTPITEQRLRSALPSSLPFDSNFAQMKIIAERNHGKVFETYGGRVTIWPPVEAHVREFEKEILAGPTRPSRSADA